MEIGRCLKLLLLIIIRILVPRPVGGGEGGIDDVICMRTSQEEQPIGIVKLLEKYKLALHARN